MGNAKTTKAKLAALAKRGAAHTGAAAKRAEDLLALIARRKDRILEDFYDIGEALIEIEKKKLYAALGYETFDELLDKRAVMGRTQAYKLVAIVRQLPRARALELGQERAYALAALAAATPGHETAGELIETGVKVHGRTQDVTKMSRRDLEAAKKQMRPARSKDPELAAAETQAKRIASALRKRHVVAHVRVVKNKKGYDAVLRAPIEDLARLLT